MAYGKSCDTRSGAPSGSLTTNTSEEPLSSAESTVRTTDGPATVRPSKTRVLNRLFTGDQPSPPVDNSPNSTLQHRFGTPMAGTASAVRNNRYRPSGLSCSARRLWIRRDGGPGFAPIPPKAGHPLLRSRPHLTLNSSDKVASPQRQAGSRPRSRKIVRNIPKDAGPGSVPRPRSEIINPDPRSSAPVRNREVEGEVPPVGTEGKRQRSQRGHPLCPRGGKSHLGVGVPSRFQG